MKTKFDYPKICSDVLSSLPQKSREIVSKRFGLTASKKRQTLQQIGDFFGVTRERVRQIESEALRKLQNDIPSQGLKSVFGYFQHYLNKQAGLKREDLLLNGLAGMGERNEVFFLLCSAPGAIRYEQDDELYAFWVENGNTRPKAEAMLNALTEKLNEKKNPFSREALYGLFPGEAKNFVDNCIEIARSIEVGPLAEIGLVAWPEIKPRGARDAAYLILKKMGRPLHFREIAANSNNLEGGFCQKRKLLPQTVHNELIRDPQFVLVGRGIYGLKEWGYNQGTVKDVIRGILKKNSAPLSRQEILEQVLRQRIVQPNTVFLGLNNKSYFKKTEEGKYTLKEI